MKMSVAKEEEIHIEYRFHIEALRFLPISNGFLLFPYVVLQKMDGRTGWSLRRTVGKY